jgi:hypothetical protein
MIERVEIPTLKVQLRAGDDVEIPCTNFSITLTNYTFSGDIRDLSDTKVTGSDLSFSSTATSVTITTTAAITTLLTTKGEFYYSYCRWVDTANKTKTWLKIIWEVV